jgi:PAS domain S-box-containing protein
MLGWTEEELIHKGLDEIFDVKNPALSTLLDDHIPSGSAKSQINYRRKDGTILNGEISSTFFFDRNGEPRAVSIIRDVTDRKRADETLREAYEQVQLQSEELQMQNEELQVQSEELHEAYEALRKNEEKYRQIVELANEGIWVSDAELRTTYTNNKMAEMLGYKPQEMIGRLATDFVDENYKAYAELRKEKRKQGIDEVHENKLVRKDGSTLWTLVNSKSIFDKAGKFTGILAMLTDITERKQAEEEREKALKTLRWSDEQFRVLVKNLKSGVALVQYFTNWIRYSSNSILISYILQKSILNVGFFSYIYSSKI